MPRKPVDNERRRARLVARLAPAAPAAPGPRLRQPERTASEARCQPDRGINALLLFKTSHISGLHDSLLLYTGRYGKVKFIFAGISSQILGVHDSFLLIMQRFGKVPH